MSLRFHDLLDQLKTELGNLEHHAKTAIAQKLDELHGLFHSTANAPLVALDTLSRDALHSIAQDLQVAGSYASMGIGELIAAIEAKQAEGLVPAASAHVELDDEAHESGDPTPASGLMTGDHVVTEGATITLGENAAPAGDEAPVSEAVSSEPSKSDGENPEPLAVFGGDANLTQVEAPAGHVAGDLPGETPAE